MRKIKALLVLLSSVLLGTQAHAQGVFDLGPLSSSIKQNGAAIAQPPSDAQVSQAKSVDFTFDVSQSLRAENTSKFVNGLAQQNPESANSLAGQDLFGMLTPALNQVGLKTNDIADAYTLWLMSVFSLYRDVKEEATPRQVAGTRKMVAATLGGATELVAAPDTEKQKLAEALILQGLLNSWLLESLQQAPDRKPEYQKEFYRVAKAEMGIDLDRFDYGPDGLYAKPQ